MAIALHASLFAFSNRRDGEFTGLAVRGGVNGPVHWIALAIRDLGAAPDSAVVLRNLAPLSVSNCGHGSGSPPAYAT